MTKFTQRYWRDQSETRPPNNLKNSKSENTYTRSLPPLPALITAPQDCMSLDDAKEVGSGSSRSRVEGEARVLRIVKVLRILKIIRILKAFNVIE